MGLFNWSGKKPEVKLAELKDRVDALDNVKDLEKNVTTPSLCLIQEDPYPLYIDTDTNNMFISYDNNATFERVDNQNTFNYILEKNKEYSTSIDVADIDTTTLYDAVGTLCNGTFNKEYKPVLQVEAPTTILENELEKRLKELESKLAKTVSLVHNCANCGATLNVEENKPVIHCKYCGSAYIVGTARIYSNY